MKILISACLSGKNCKYNGNNNYRKKIVEHHIKDYLVEVCPEELGGLSTPRDPSEIVGDKVITNKGFDVTKQFHEGARETLMIAQEENVEMAILKEYSPSCGCNYVYDGTFSNKKIKGIGITAKLLIENGIVTKSDEEYK